MKYVQPIYNASLVRNIPQIDSIDRKFYHIVGQSRKMESQLS